MSSFNTRYVPSNHVFTIRNPLTIDRLDDAQSSQVSDDEGSTAANYKGTTPDGQETSNRGDFEELN